MQLEPSIGAEDRRLRKILTLVMAGRAFMIKTSPATRYLLKLTSWLTTGSHGAIVYGRPRLGKTMATRWILGAIRQLMGYVPSLEVPTRDQRLASEREFFQYVLRCAKHKFYDVGSAGDKRDRLTEWLVARARRSPLNAFILFIDEAHRLTELHFTWLLNIDNELDMHGCRLFCLLVGQTELTDKKTRLIDRGMEQIVGRFMVREFEFPGIRNLSELTACLNEFNNTEYPAGSETTFPQIFIPHAVAGGEFKLDDLAPAVWSAFEGLSSRAAGEGAFEIPMHYLTASLTEMLYCLRKTDKSPLQVPEALIKKCVSASGYSDSLRAHEAFEYET